MGYFIRNCVKQCYTRYKRETLQLTSSGWRTQGRWRRWWGCWHWWWPRGWRGWPAGSCRSSAQPSASAWPPACPRHSGHCRPASPHCRSLQCCKRGHTWERDCSSPTSPVWKSQYSFAELLQKLNCGSKFVLIELFWGLLLGNINSCEGRVLCVSILIIMTKLQTSLTPGPPLEAGARGRSGHSRGSRRRSQPCSALRWC